MERYQRYESNRQTDKTSKTEKPDIRKMMKYTAKKILWVTNYSLSFSKKDETKEIFIKLLGCVIILQCLSLIISFSLNTAQIFLSSPFSACGFLFLTGIFIFKKEIVFFLKFKKQKRETENVKRKPSIS